METRKGVDTIDTSMAQVAKDEQVLAPSGSLSFINTPGYSVIPISIPILSAQSRCFVLSQLNIPEWLVLGAWQALDGIPAAGPGFQQGYIFVLFVSAVFLGFSVAFMCSRIQQFRHVGVWLLLLCRWPLWSKCEAAPPGCRK